MKAKEFHSIRENLGKTQKQVSHLLGTSLKAIQSFEQGWRKIPVHVERQLFFLLAMRMKEEKSTLPCWDIRHCSTKDRETCPAWEFKCGHLCWFINGTICQGKLRAIWSKKMVLCKKCDVFTSLMEP